MRISYILILAVIFMLNMVSLNAPLAQDDLTISDCERRCGIRTEFGQVIGNYQAIYACRARCSQEFWKKVDGEEKEGRKRR